MRQRSTALCTLVLLGGLTSATPAFAVTKPKRRPAPAKPKPVGTAPRPPSAPTSTTTGTSTKTSTSTKPTANASTIDRTRLVLGDGKTSNVPTPSMVFSCQGGASAKSSGNARPWLNGDGTWNAKLKPTVQGDVMWSAARATWGIANGQRTLAGTGLPSHGTGVFPIASSDPVFTYDRNPNSIRAQTLSISVALKPQLAATPSCLSGGAIGYTLGGVALFNGFDADQRDAPAHEIQDKCGGHPEKNGSYHYHNLSACLENAGSGHSAIIGFAMDGFAIFGVRGESGAELTNADLDECHGHTHEVTIDGAKVSQYHYHATAVFPYLLGCFRGTPTRLGPGTGGVGAGGAGAGGAPKAEVPTAAPVQASADPQSAPTPSAVVTPASLAPATPPSGPVTTKPRLPTPPPGASSSIPNQE